MPTFDHCTPETVGDLSASACIPAKSRPHEGLGAPICSEWSFGRTLSARYDDQRVEKGPGAVVPLADAPACVPAPDPRYEKARAIFSSFIWFLLSFFGSILLSQGHDGGYDAHRRGIFAHHVVLRFVYAEQRGRVSVLDSGLGWHKVLTDRYHRIDAWGG